MHQHRHRHRAQPAGPAAVAGLCAAAGGGGAPAVMHTVGGVSIGFYVSLLARGLTIVNWNLERLPILHLQVPSELLRCLLLVCLGAVVGSVQSLINQWSTFQFFA